MYEPQRRWTARNKGTPRFKYMTQRTSAQTRGIPFLLTFEEWWRIWEDSGHWAARGRRRGQYVMARRGDQGAYEVGNVVIRCAEENVVEGLLGRPVSKQTRERMSKTHTGKVMSEQARERMSKAKAGCTRIDWPDGTRTYVQKDEHDDA
jgi:NUMOD3 motif